MLLLDQNISRRIVAELQFSFPGTIHVSAVGLDTADDVIVWDYALQNSLTIVTHDADFEHLAAYKGFPPKVIHLVRGNLSKQQMVEVLVVNALRLRKFVDSEEEGYLALN